MSDTNKTKVRPDYPENQTPDLIILSEENQNYRYVLGKKPQRSEQPLVAVCMNPSAADLEKSDNTVNTVIHTAQRLKYDGWIVVNVYPEYATDAKQLQQFDSNQHQENLKAIKKIIDNYSITEVWGAWGNPKQENIKKALLDIKKILKDKGIQILSSKVNPSGEPHHPRGLKKIMNKEAFSAIKIDIIA